MGLVFVPPSISFLSNCSDNDGDEGFLFSANIILLLIMNPNNPVPTAANPPNPNNCPSSPCICLPEPLPIRAP